MSGRAEGPRLVITEGPTREQAAGGWQAVIKEIPVWWKHLSGQFLEQRPMLGVVVDADDDADKRWAAIRRAFVNENAQLETLIPETPVPDGFRVEAASVSGLNVGAAIWLMPDNGGRGDLERFLLDAIPDAWKDTKQHAISAAHIGRSTFEREAKVTLAAGSVHKAELGCYLSCGQGPDLSYGFNIRDGAFDMNHPGVQAYAKWLCDVLGIEVGV